MPDKVRIDSLEKRVIQLELEQAALERRLEKLENQDRLDEMDARLSTQLGRLQKNLINMGEGEG